jgi:hypothetical protein
MQPAAAISSESYSDPPTRSSDVLPEALRDALGQVIANERREWRRERELIEAQSRETVAELRARVIELERKAEETIASKLSEVRSGVDGTPGNDGRDGIDGAPGRDGVDGKDGEPGRDGIDGAPGAEGPAGPPGSAGEPGPQGERGDRGDPGRKGL